MATTAATASTPNEHRMKLQEMVRKAVDLAEEAGCQLRPMQSNPTVLRGICPFHYATTMQNANTFRLDTHRATFRCIFCEVNGTMASFAALMWEVSIPEAIQIMNAGDHLSIDRPVPICMREPEASNDPRFRAQNSHLLTKATQFYAAKISRSHECISFLTRLGITISQTEMMKIGYAEGKGLIDHLKAANIPDEEIIQSTLINLDTRGRPVERYDRRLVIPHLDTSGNTAWMMLIHAAAPDLDESWDVKPHRPTELWGRRPYMLGFLGIRKNQKAICVTDDIRIYLVANALGASPAYTMGRDTDEHFLRIAQRLNERAPNHLTIACSNPEVGQGIAQAYNNLKSPKATSVTLNPEQVQASLEPTTRKNAWFIPEQPARPRDKDAEPPPQTERPPQTQNEGDDVPQTAEPLGQN